MPLTEAEELELLELENEEAMLSHNAEPQTFIEKTKSESVNEVDEQPNFRDRIGQHWEDRKGKVAEIQKDIDEGKVGELRGELHKYGMGPMGFYTDVGGEVVSAALPDFIEKPAAEAIGGAIGYFSKLPSNVKDAPTMGEFINKKVTELYKYNKNLARDFESALNFLQLFAPEKAIVSGKKAVADTVVGTTKKYGSKISEAMARSAETSVKKVKKDFVDSLVSPKVTKKVALEQARRAKTYGTKGNKIKVPLAVDEEAAANEILNLGVNRKYSFQKNANIVKDAVFKETDSLVKKLKDNDFLIPKKDLKNYIDNKVSSFIKEEEFFLDENIAKAAKRISNAANMVIDKNKGTASGVLQARKDFDKVTEKILGQFKNSPKTTEARLISNKIRKEMNEFLISKSTNVDVKSSLRKQSDMLTGYDNILEKAADEIVAAAQRAESNARAAGALSGTSAVARGAVSGGKIGVASAAIDVAAKPAQAIYAKIADGVRSGKISSDVKVSISNLLEATKKAMDYVSPATSKGRTQQGQTLFEQLRADRMLLLELIEGEEQSKPSEEKK